MLFCIRNLKGEFEFEALNTVSDFSPWFSLLLDWGPLTLIGDSVNLLEPALAMLKGLRLSCLCSFCLEGLLLKAWHCLRSFF